MIAAFRSEWIKLGRRNFLVGGFGTIIGFAVLMTVVGIFNADADPETVAGPPGIFGGGIGLESAGGWLAGLSQAGTFIGIIALALFAANIAAEFSTGSIRVLLTTQPRRATVMCGKILRVERLRVAGGVLRRNHQRHRRLSLGRSTRCRYVGVDHQ